MDTNNKLQIVSAWLRELFVGEEVPAFEINTNTIALLHDLAVLNQEQNNLLGQVAEQAAECTSSFNSKGINISFSRWCSSTTLPTLS